MRPTRPVWIAGGLAATAVGAAAAFWLDVAVWRVAVALIAAGWLAASRRLPERRATRLLVLLAVASLSQTTAVNLWRFSTSPWIRVWNVYHYYLGSKYFDELGYHDLYSATLRADREGDDYWHRVRRVRNLETYAVESRSTTADRYRPGDHFTAARWREFRDDVAALRVHRSPRRWRDIFTDRGYNPSPLWTVVGGGLATLLPAQRLPSLKVLCGLDLLLMAATFWALARVFGLRAAAWALLFFTLTPVNDNRLVGGFLQYDWFFAVAGGLCLLRRGRSWPAGALMAYAVMTRVFPLILVASAGIPLVVEWINSGGFRRRELAFFLSFGVFCGAGFGAGCLTASGVDAWTQFAGNLGHHASEHVYGSRRVGLKHLFTRDAGTLVRGESEVNPREVLAGRQGLYTAAAAVFVVAWLAAALRRNTSDALLLGLAPLFALAVSSRYYWSYLALLPLLEPDERSRADWPALGQVGLYGVVSLYELLRDPKPYALYMVFNLGLGLLLLGLLALYLRRDLAELAERAPPAGGEESPPRSQTLSSPKGDRR